MPEICYATTNSGKVKSLQRHLGQYGITVVQAPLDIPEPRSNDVQEIAEHKARFAHNALKKPVVVLDAGFYIPSLNGFPRAFVNFALETIGLEGILRLAEDKDRYCEFRECLAYMEDGMQEPRYFIAHVRGTLAGQPRGTKQSHLWSELGLIFIPNGSARTLAEFTPDEYAAWSKSRPDEESPGKMFGKWYANRQ